MSPKRDFGAKKHLKMAIFGSKTPKNSPKSAFFTVFIIFRKSGKKMHGAKKKLSEFGSGFLDQLPTALPVDLSGFRVYRWATCETKGERMKTKILLASRLLMVAGILLLVPACSSTRPKPVAKAAKVSARATVEGAKASAGAVKNTAGAVIGK